MLVRAAPGTPAYKTPEEYYDEVLELRKQIGILDRESGVLRAKLRRVEEDNLKKEKEIESLMDPSKVVLHYNKYNLLLRYCQAQRKLKRNL